MVPCCMAFDTHAAGKTLTAAGASEDIAVAVVDVAQRGSGYWPSGEMRGRRPNWSLSTSPVRACGTTRSKRLPGCDAPPSTKALCAGSDAPRKRVTPACSSSSAPSYLAGYMGCSRWTTPKLCAGSDVPPNEGTIARLRRRSGPRRSTISAGGTRTAWRAAGSRRSGSLVSFRRRARGRDAQEALDRLR